jgi:hypothetical protein
MRITLAILLVGSTFQPSQSGRFQVMEATIDDVQAALKSKQITCRQLVDRYLRCIEAYDKTGPFVERGPVDQSESGGGSGSA